MAGYKPRSLARAVIVDYSDRSLTGGPDLFAVGVLETGDRRTPDSFGCAKCCFVRDSWSSVRRLSPSIGPNFINFSVFLVSEITFAAHFFSMTVLGGHWTVGKKCRV